ncbi:DEAD/DEAH box helicase, partial [Enterococcus faecium]
MELGVDVGDLDAVVLNGYPGTSASFWQQCGRSGRGARDGLAIFLAHPEPLEHYLAGNPEAILEGKGESAALDPLNPFVFADQLRCAA